jgi:hypothetical protein
MYKTGSSPVVFAFRYQSVAGYFLSTGYSKLLSLLISMSGAEKRTSHPVKLFLSPSFIASIFVSTACPTHTTRAIMASKPPFGTLARGLQTFVGRIFLRDTAIRGYGKCQK